MTYIVVGASQPSREFAIDALHVRQIRQAKFADLIDVQLATLRNLEPGRRESAGPTKAGLHAIMRYRFMV